MSDQCNDDVYKYGESVGIVDMSKEDCEAHCKKLTAESDYIYDWHSAMGRKHVMRLRKGFVKEQRYLVIKTKELVALTPEEHVTLGTLMQKLAVAREAQSKKPLEGVFIESGWKCHDAAWKLVRQEWETNQ